MLLMEKARPDRQTGRVFFVLQMLPSPIYFCCVTPMSGLPTPGKGRKEVIVRRIYDLIVLAEIFLILRAIDSILGKILM